MTPNDARREISNLASELVRARLAAAINTPRITTQGSTARITWPAATVQSGLLSDLPFASIVEYRKLVIGGHYVALMNDGALLQLSVDIRNDSLVGHRMCFYPCPVIVPLDFDILAFDELDFLLMQELESHLKAIESGLDPESVTLRLRSPLRFDFDPDAASAIEPASHVHISNSVTRIAVHAPLSVGHFVQFVFRHFYPEVWDDPSLNRITRWPLHQMTRCITDEDEFRLHVSCRHQIGAQVSG